MRWQKLSILGCASVLGRRLPTALAVEDGRYDLALSEAHGYDSISVVDDPKGPGVLDSAVEAALKATELAAVPANEVRLVVHVSCESYGPAGVPPASYIQGRTIGTPALAVEFNQGCNGVLAAIELAGAYLVAQRDPTHALITTSDRAIPGQDRFATAQAEVCGDGATALVLSTTPGLAQVLSSSVLGDGRFLHQPPPDPAQFPDRAARLSEQRRRLRPMVASMAELQQRCIDEALADADIEAKHVGRWAFANAGAFLVDERLRSRNHITPEKTTWDWGRMVGHLGAGNQSAALDHLLQTGAVGPGDHVALCGNGVGFSYGCVVLRIEQGALTGP